MATIGARELKLHTGEWLERVSRGESVVVTHRGRPVVVMRPVEQDEQARIETMIAAGGVTWACREPLPVARPMDVGGARLADAITEDREERL